MGQYWEFINADSEQSISMGKFGECFPGVSAGWLAPLVIPLTPYDQTYGQWAGDRIILLGDCATDFPEGFLELEDNAVDDDDDNLDWFTENCVTVGLPQDLPSSTSVWVLRNLSKQEYVRSSGIPLRLNRALVHRQRIGLADSPGLADVLISRIGWSSDPSVSMSYKGPLQLHRGSWAGDRFDVRVFDDVIESMKEEGGWVDITRIAARDLYDVYRSEFLIEGEFEEEPQESDSEE